MKTPSTKKTVKTMSAWAIVQSRFIDADNASHLQIYETKDAANRYGHYDDDEVVPCKITYSISNKKRT